MTIDLNADLGEGCGNDADMLPWVTSANIACGFHAGDADTMRRTLELAAALGVSVGAHPGFRDRAHFGRRELIVQANALATDLLEQLESFADVARILGMRPRHMKLHGALYHMAARDPAMAELVTQAVRRVDPALVVFTPARSALALAAEAAGMRVAREAFADRAYQSDGALAPRGQTGGMISDAGLASARVVHGLRKGWWPAMDGAPLPFEAETLCVHGDTPGAALFTKKLREALDLEGVTCASISG